ncbi:MAG: MFS transporter, partial [Streptococcaceae bacterium]|nr:MFS transporter [Streptococcaceae bacterium]
AGFNLGIYFLLFARFIQAIGASMTMSNSFGITTSCFPPHQRARAMATIGIFVSLGAVTGPGLGGIILQFMPWSYIFWVNVPIGIIAMLMGQKLFPKDDIATPFDRKLIDWSGTILFFFAISLLFLGIEIGQNTSFTSPPVLISLVIAVILFILFLEKEKIAQAPMIQLDIFKNKLFTISLISALLIFVTNFFASIIMPFYLQSYLKFSPGVAGGLMMVFPIVMMIVGPIAGVIADKWNKEILTAIGIVFVVFAQFGYTRLNADSSMFTIILITAINALGTGLFQSPNSALVMSTVEPKYLGVAGSINALARNLGMIIGISLATTTLFATMSAQYGKRVTEYISSRPDVFLSGMHVAFLVSFGVGILTFIVVGSRVFVKKDNA